MEDPRRFRAVTRLLVLIEWAYDVRDFQISGGPAWVTQARFTVQAVAEQPAAKAQMRQMLQALLAERFALRVHRETKEMSVYALVLGKNEPKLKLTEDQNLYKGEGKFDVGTGILVSAGGTMDGLCTILTDNLDRPVIDRTALTGRYDFRLNFDPPAAGPGWTPFGAAIFAPLQSLGLKLEPKKDRVEMLVIDSASKPGEN